MMNRPASSVTTRQDRTSKYQQLWQWCCEQSWISGSNVFARNIDSTLGIRFIWESLRGRGKDCLAMSSKSAYSSSSHFTCFRFCFFLRALLLLLLLILIRIPSRRDDFNRFLFRLGLSWKGTDTINSSLYCYTAPASKANWMNPFLL